MPQISNFGPFCLSLSVCLHHVHCFGQNFFYLHAQHFKQQRHVPWLSTLCRTGIETLGNRNNVSQGRSSQVQEIHGYLYSEVACLVPGNIPATLRVALTCIIIAVSLSALNVRSTEEHLSHTSDCFPAGWHAETSLANNWSIALFVGKTLCGAGVLGNVMRSKKGKTGIAKG